MWGEIEQDDKIRTERLLHIYTQEEVREEKNEQK